MATDMFYGASPEMFRRAKELRRNLTPSEQRVWEHLKDNQLSGFRFKSQHPIQYFIADFYSHAAKLVVEIDGEIHNEVEQQQYDLNRNSIMEEFGIQVLRFTNEQVAKDLEVVLETIRRALHPPSPFNPPSP